MRDMTDLLQGLVGERVMINHDARTLLILREVLEDGLLLSPYTIEEALNEEPAGEDQLVLVPRREIKNIQWGYGTRLVYDALQSAVAEARRGHEPPPAITNPDEWLDQLKKNGVH